MRRVDFALYACAGVAFYRLCRFEANRIFPLMDSIAWLYFGHHDSFNLGGLYTEQYAAISGIFAVASASAYPASGISDGPLQAVSPLRRRCSSGIPAPRRWLLRSS